MSALPPQHTDPGTPGSPQPPGQPRPSRGSTGGRTAVIITAVIGGVVLLGVLAVAVIGGLLQSYRSGPTSERAEATGVQQVEIDADAARFTLRFADVSDATLESGETGRGGWRLERDGARLTVTGPPWPFNGCFGFCLSLEEDVVLTLPAALDNGELGLDVTVDAGEFSTEGSFGDLSTEISAGSVRIRGDAQHVNATVSAGRAELDLNDVATGRFNVSAGNITAKLHGSPPEQTDVSVSAGSVNLTLPREVYRVRSDISAGGLDNRLDTSNDSPYEIDVTVSAGNAVLRPAA